MAVLEKKAFFITRALFYLSEMCSVLVAHHGGEARGYFSVQQRRAPQHKLFRTNSSFFIKMVKYVIS